MFLLADIQWIFHASWYHLLDVVDLSIWHSSRAEKVVPERRYLHFRLLAHRFCLLYYGSSFSANWFTELLPRTPRFVTKIFPRLKYCSSFSKSRLFGILAFVYRFWDFSLASKSKEPIVLMNEDIIQSDVILICWILCRSAQNSEAPFYLQVVSVKPIEECPEVCNKSICLVRCSLAVILEECISSLNHEEVVLPRRNLETSTIKERAYWASQEAQHALVLYLHLAKSNRSHGSDSSTYSHNIWVHEVFHGGYNVCKDKS